MPINRAKRCLLCKKDNPENVYDCLSIVINYTDYGQSSYSEEEHVAPFTSRYGICNDCINVKIPFNAFKDTGLFSKREQSVRNKFTYLMCNYFKEGTIPLVPEELDKIKKYGQFTEYCTCSWGSDTIKAKIYDQLIKTGKWREYNDQEIPDHLQTKDE